MPHSKLGATLIPTVVDLLAPYARGGKIGLFGGAGVGKTVFIQELIVCDLVSFISLDIPLMNRSTEQHCQGPWWLLRVHWCR